MVSRNERQTVLFKVNLLFLAQEMRVGRVSPVSPQVLLEERARGLREHGYILETF